jgi:uncharacterized oxidoreductase
MVKIRAQALQDLVRDVFVAAGCSEKEGTQLGKSLVGANLAGHDSHGVVRVPRYIEWKEEGAFLADQTLKIVSETPVLAVVDGQYGFGQTMAPQAVEIGIKKAKAMGLSAIALRNSGHVGRVGEWAEMAADAGLVSIHYCNAPQSLLVAPYGGVDRRLSTAPYSVGIPRSGGQPPLILDFATSVVAEGKVLVASQGGKTLPADALVSVEGKPSSDPRELYGEYDPASGARDHKKGKGALRAFGDHKGSGLALMCELLGGALTGNGASDPEKRWSQGMFSFYVDPERIDPEHLLPAELSRFLAYVKSTKPIDANEPVLLPGEPEARRRADRLENGIPLTDETCDALRATARSVGIDDRLLA